MKIENHAQFVEMLAVVFDNYSKELSPALADFWWSLMQTYDLQAVRDAFNRHCINPDNGQWVPKPADIVKLIDGGTLDAALIAWSLVDLSVRSIGPWKSVSFEDKIINAVIADMGGWPRMNEDSDEDWPFKAKEFQTRYRGYKTTGGAAAFPEKLIGLTDMANRQAGAEDSPVTFIGSRRTGPLALKKPDND